VLENVPLTRPAACCPSRLRPLAPRPTCRGRGEGEEQRGIAAACLADRGPGVHCDRWPVDRMLFSVAAMSEFGRAELPALRRALFAGGLAPARRGGVFRALSIFQFRPPHRLHSPHGPTRFLAARFRDSCRSAKVASSVWASRQAACPHARRVMLQQCRPAWGCKPARATSPLRPGFRAIVAVPRRRRASLID